MIDFTKTTPHHCRTTTTCCHICNLQYAADLVTPTVKPTMWFYMTRVVPIGLGQALTFKFGMQSYIYLSVAFIQMMKSVTPATTMAALALLGTMPDSIKEVAAVLAICFGTMLAAYGEVRTEAEDTVQQGLL